MYRRTRKYAEHRQHAMQASRDAARRVIVIGHIDGKQGDWRTHQPATGEPVSH